MSAPQQCNRCRFWIEKLEHRDPNDDGWVFGSCRREPPRLVECIVKKLMPKLEYGQQADPDIDEVTLTSASLFPATHSTDWCGRFKEGEPASEAARTGVVS